MTEGFGEAWREMRVIAGRVAKREIDGVAPGLVAGSRRTKGLSVLVMPWPLVVGEDLSNAVEAWVKAGGTLITETELGAFDERAFYVYPEERRLAGAFGLRSQGRRPAGTLGRLEVRLVTGRAPDQGCLPVEGWLETFDPEGCDVVALAPGEGAVAVRRTVGNGSVLALGTLVGLGYLRSRERGLERWVRHKVQGACGRSGVSVAPGDGEVVQWRMGKSGESWLFFVTAEDPVTAVRARFDRGLLREGATVDDIVGHATVEEGDGTERTVSMMLSEDGVGVFRWDA
jgi:hypothetical protein